MKPGRQWLVFDAEFFDNSLTKGVAERFGAAGVTLFVAFLCACKTSRIPGRFSYRTEWQALENLGVEWLQLVDAAGLPFTLDEFWTYTGRHKQTRRTARGGTIYVQATRWEEWQNDKKRLLARERQRRSRANSERDASVTERDSDSDIDNDRVTTSRKPNFKTLEPPHYQPWLGDPNPKEPIVSRDAISSLLRRSTDVDG